ncbi:MAG: PilZ domain-containing protein [Dehalococcoidia bacterium]|jgi:c-di-GMP-binding flagellar brake protein YcgR
MGFYPEKGQEIKVQVIKDPDRLYSSKLSDINENSFIIELFLDPEEQISLTPNEPLIVYFSVPDHYYRYYLYEFEATILECRKKRFIKITRPTEKGIIRLQRRDFLRFYCNINATFKFISISNDDDNQIHKASIIKASIINLSAGGAGLKSKKEISLKDVIELKFHYAEDNIRPVDITAIGEVVRMGRSNTGEFTFDIKFTYINENGRRIIMDIADNYYRKLRKRLIFIT